MEGKSPGPSKELGGSLQCPLSGVLIMQRGREPNEKRLELGWVGRGGDNMLTWQTLVNVVLSLSETMILWL